LSENPLLPHRKLKELYLLMLRCRQLDRKQSAKAKSGAREALLAATAIHLLPGDLLCGTANDAAAEELAPVGKTGKVPGYVDAQIESRLPICAALARGLQAAGTDGVVLTYTAADTKEPGWMNSLSWAQEAELPLILVCADATGGAKPKGTGKKAEERLTWVAVEAFARKVRVPILAVDGDDAVAVYRCMQESVIRARNGCGPAILWAVTSSPKTVVPRSRQPLARLESYLKVRNIQLPKRS
jgi:pyruvate dehydrogenase E1 component alpha subunit